MLASELLGSACLFPRAGKISTGHCTRSASCGGVWESKSCSPAHLASTSQTELSSQPPGCFPQLLVDRTLWSEGLTNAWPNKHGGSPHETDAAHRGRNMCQGQRLDGWVWRGLRWSRVTEPLCAPCGTMKPSGSLGTQSISGTSLPRARL